jgi:hypothetical protein
MFRVSRDRMIEDADSFEGARAMMRGQKRGRYHVDEILADPFPSSHKSRAWGSLIKHPDGKVEDERHPWSS